MNIRIISIGKIKEQFLKDGIAEYVKRLSKYCRVEIIEVNDSSISSNPSIKEIEMVKNDEASRVLKLIKNTDYIVNLDMNQKEYKSEDFAEFLDKKIVEAKSNLTFVIGGSYGLSDNLKKRANDSISLSKMTFLHQMTKLILLEQIYRAFKILNNETYQK